MNSFASNDVPVSPACPSFLSPITVKSLEDQILITWKLRSLRGIQKKTLLNVNMEAFC